MTTLYGIQKLYQFWFHERGEIWHRETCKGEWECRHVHPVPPTAPAAKPTDANKNVTVAWLRKSLRALNSDTRIVQGTRLPELIQLHMAQVESGNLPPPSPAFSMDLKSLRESPAAVSSARSELSTSDLESADRERPVELYDQFVTTNA